MDSAYPLTELNSYFVPLTFISGLTGPCEEVETFELDCEVLLLQPAIDTTPPKSNAEHTNVFNIFFIYFSSFFLYIA